MFNLFGIRISDNKTILSLLLRIYGIGTSRAKFICKKLNIKFDKKIFKLNSIEKRNIKNSLKSYKLNNELKILVKNDIKNLINIKCYRGIRHRRGLPCRGQRTKTNSRTVRFLKKNEKYNKK